MSGRIDRGGRTDTRQRRAFQQLDQGTSSGGAGGSVTLDPNGGLIFVSGNLSIKLDTDPGLALGAGGLSFVPSAIALDTFGMPTDITTLNATTGHHGLLPKLPGGTTLFLRGDGTYATPPVVTTLNKTVQLDFGVSSTSSGSFTVTDTDIISGSIVQFQRSFTAASGRDADENEFAVMNLEVTQSIGSLAVLIEILDGRVSGPFVFQYSIIHP